MPDAEGSTRRFRRALRGMAKTQQSIWLVGRNLTLAERYKLFAQWPVTPDDIAILKRADEILASEAVWNRSDTRDCSRLAGSWSLFCALKAASIDITGRYDNRRVAIEEIRFAIIEVMGMDIGRPNVHPLMIFNNLPATRFEDIKKVLRMAGQRLAARIA